MTVFAYSHLYTASFGHSVLSTAAQDELPPNVPAFALRACSPHGE
jgi:hypothetical protein